MALVTCAGSDVISGRIRLPLRGAWAAELSLDTQKLPSGAVTIAADGGLSIKGTVTTGGVFLDVARINLVGGAGGMAKIVPAAAYRNAQLRDPLNAILNAGGEKLSNTTAQGVLATSLPFWSTTAAPVALALDALCGAAGVGWRVLADGSIWLGTETWPNASLPASADLVDEAPEDGRYVIGVATPDLLPGVNLSDISKHVRGVDHWISADKIRTVAWT